jgi:glutathione synthase/RimK-type ligase-like ATP-grasp enzyme
MEIVIHPESVEGGIYGRRWAECLRERKIQIKCVDLTSLNTLREVERSDGVMWRWAHTPQDRMMAPLILRTIEECMGIPVFPNHQTSWHYNNKIAQHYLLRANKAPMPETWIFWNRDQALDWAEKSQYPVVFKLSVGAGSSNVCEVPSKIQAQRLIIRMFDEGIFPLAVKEEERWYVPRYKWQLREMVLRLEYVIKYLLGGIYPPLPSFWWQPEKGYVYFQEFVPNNPSDTRITVIGNRAFGFIRLNRPDDFRASGSGRLEMDPSQVDLRCVEVAFAISKKLDFQSMAYDFLMRDGKPVITEISYAFADWAVHRCPGHWDDRLNWIEGHMWPEEAQVDDFVEYIEKTKVIEK